MRFLQPSGLIRVDGYVGGSTLDRIPIEDGVVHTTAAFKKSFAEFQVTWSMMVRLERFGERIGFPGRSDATVRTLARIGALNLAEGATIALSGELGTGRQDSRPHWLNGSRQAVGARLSVHLR